MLRLVLLVLFHWFKRVSASIASIRPDRVESDYSRFDVSEQDDRWSVWTMLIVWGLVFYILGSLGYYAKVHMWDSLTVEQQSTILLSMTVNQQVL